MYMSICIGNTRYALVQPDLLCPFLEQGDCNGLGQGKQGYYGGLVAECKVRPVCCAACCCVYGWSEVRMVCCGSRDIAKCITTVQAQC